MSLFQNWTRVEGKAFSGATTPMRSFEATFAIPPEHRLELIRSRIRGGLLRGEYWEHQELDAPGEMVVRYESFTETDPKTGAIHSGWYRYGQPRS
jgi:hypothetical protein